MRSGDDYRAAVRDGRVVLLDGEPVSDVTSHAAFRGAIGHVASVYDERAAGGADWMAADGDGVLRPAEWVLPRDVAGLTARRRAHEAWARGSYGLMGRTPDHVASVLTAFAGSADVFGRSGEQFADNVRRYHARVRDEDLYVAYAIVPTQIDRSRSVHQQPEPFLCPGIVDERDDGIVVRGAQTIATSVVMADEVLVSYIVPLGPGDEDYAVSFAVPVSTPGVRIHPRRPYATAATSAFDYPLSTRFDETDAMLVLDDVLVPWDRVFVHRDVGLCAAQFFETGAHVLANFQSLVRFTTKLEFIAGLTRRLTALHGKDASAPVQAALGGEIACVVATIEALVLAAEREAVVDVWARPHPRFVYAAMSLQRRTIVDLMRSVRELAGASFVALPSSAASLASPASRPDIDRYLRGVTVDAESRIKLLRVLWDLVGTEFAGRQLQYEMFYSAAQNVVDMRLFRTFGWERSLALADACLAGLTVEPQPEVVGAAAAGGAR